MKNVLIINAGSSSLKYQVVDMDTGKVLAKGLAERIGLDHSDLVHQPAGGEKITIEVPMKNHGDALQAVISAITDKDHGVLPDMSSIKAVGHRVLHGGETFRESVLIDDQVLDHIREFIPLGPLHVPANLKGIETTMELMPGVPNVAVFDTAFHQTMPDYAYLYALPMDVYKEHGVRRYGFHGTSHRYLSIEVPKMLGLDPKHLKLITCHLGNGSSIAAIKDGRCLDTSMGLTPLEGLAMGTRSGDIDPAAITFLMDKLDMTAEETIDYLNKQSGMLGLSGVSSDFRDLWEAADAGNEQARLALHLFSYRVKKYIGAYAAVLDGLDVLCFAGGVGENDELVRKEICEHMNYLGIELDEEANRKRGGERIISKPDSKVTVVVVPTDEEMMIARDTVEVAGL
ncbi:MAG: acetate kinase [Clostridia bacterium]|nr:acetate kinase [Clostridia bacterium]